MKNKTSKTNRKLNSVKKDKVSGKYSHSLSRGSNTNKAFNNKQSNKINNNRKKITLYALGIWWATFSVIGATQQYFSTLKFYFIILAIIAPIIILLAHKYLYKALVKNKSWAKLTILIYGLAHFIPLLLQLIGIRQPGFDTIITLAIGLFLLDLLD